MMSIGKNGLFYANFSPISRCSFSLRWFSFNRITVSLNCFPFANAKIVYKFSYSLRYALVAPSKSSSNNRIIDNINPLYCFFFAIFFKVNFRIDVIRFDGLAYHHIMMDERIEMNLFIEKESKQEYCKWNEHIPFVSISIYGTISSLFIQNRSIE